MVEQVAKALDAAHARGLVHRDVKPSNVLLDATGHMYLADFGLTRRLGDTGTAADGLMGTIDYVAPEQIRGSEVDGRADLYSFGCLLYESLSGRPPLQNESDVAVLFAHLNSEPPTLRGLEAVLPQALAKNPAERFDSCAALVGAAQVALGLERPARRRRVLVAAALVCAAAVSAVIVLALELGGPSPPKGARGMLDRVDLASGVVTRRRARKSGPFSWGASPARAISGSSSSQGFTPGVGGVMPLSCRWAPFSAFGAADVVHGLRRAAPTVCWDGRRSLRSWRIAGARVWVRARDAAYRDEADHTVVDRQQVDGIDHCPRVT